ncbi:MAG: penicillin-binding transpeptidase domain-containing protein [Terriglobia bacterium]
MPGSKEHSPTLRYRALPILLGLWAAVVVGRLVHVQIVQFEELSRQARRQQERTLEVSPQRAVIYDRNLNPLAISVEVDSVFAVPGEISDPAAAARLLAPVLDMGVSEIRARLRGTGARYFSWVKRKVTGREAARIRELNIRGIYFQKENKRFYPKRELAAHVLGYVGVDDQGLAGIEQSHEQTIRGEPGQLLIERDARQRWFRRTGRHPEPGQSVVLTLDETIQYIAERELGAAMKQSRALAGTVIVLDPFTGEVLAMANSPTFNPNRHSEVLRDDVLRNRAIADAYEPGSTFKIVTLAAALEEGLTDPAELIDCQMGAIVIAGHTIRDHKPFGVMSVSQILQYSSDVGAIKLAMRVGNQRFYRYWRTFGFGSLTGIELPGEAVGLTKPPERWSKISIGAMAMGQEVGVTPLQLAVATSVVANGGWWVPPHILRERARTAPPGEVVMPEARRVLGPETADQLQRMMTEVVTLGTGKLGRPEGYTAAGKTGTAQKIDPATGRYSPTDHVASFVGYAPAESPLFTILVALDSPRGRYHGGDAAAPVFQRIAEQVLAYRNVPAIVAAKLPVSQAPRSEPALPPVPDLFNERNPAALLVQDEFTIVAPDLLGRTVRSVTEKSLGEKWAVHPIGNGIAVRQFPPAGTPLAEGQKITVWFQVGGVIEPGKSPREKLPTMPSGRPAPGVSSPPSGPARPNSVAELAPAAG